MTTPLTAEAVAEMRAQLLNKYANCPDWVNGHEIYFGIDAPRRVWNALFDLAERALAPSEPASFDTMMERHQARWRSRTPDLAPVAPSSNAEVAREIVTEWNSYAADWSSQPDLTNLRDRITAALDAKDRASWLVLGDLTQKHEFGPGEIMEAKDREPAKAPVLTVPPLTDDQKEYLNDIQAAAAEAERDDWRKLYYETIGFVGELERRRAELEAALKTIADGTVGKHSRATNSNQFLSDIRNETMRIAHAALSSGTPHLDALLADARREGAEEMRDRIAQDFEPEPPRLCAGHELAAQISALPLTRNLASMGATLDATRKKLENCPEPPPVAQPAERTVEDIVRELGPIPAPLADVLTGLFRAERERTKAAVASALGPLQWECDKCGFAFDASHSNADGSYSCPSCAQDELERRCAELEGEREYWRSQVDADRKMVATVAAEEAARPLQRKCAELEAALQPFTQTDADDLVGFSDNTPWLSFEKITIGDLRRAREALSSGTPHLDKLLDDARREGAELAIDEIRREHERGADDDAVYRHISECLAAIDRQLPDALPLSPQEG